MDQNTPGNFFKSLSALLFVTCESKENSRVERKILTKDTNKSAYDTGIEKTCMQSYNIV